MSRCECCNVILSPAELTIKSANTGLFLDTCSSCLSTIDIDFLSNDDITLELGTNIALFDYREDCIDNDDDIRYNQ